MTTPTTKTNFYHSRSKFSIRNTKSTSNLPWQQHISMAQDNIELKSTDEILKKINYSGSDQMPNPPEDERIGDYKNLFGESTVESNMQYLNQQFLRKSKNHELAKQEEHKKDTEKSKKGRRAQSQAGSTPTKPPARLKVTESLRITNSSVEVDSNLIKEELSPLGVKVQVSKANTSDSLDVVLSKNQQTELSTINQSENQNNHQTSQSQITEHSSMVRETNLNEVENLQNNHSVSHNEDEVIIDFQGQTESSNKSQKFNSKENFLGLVGNFINYFESSASEKELKQEEEDIYLLPSSMINENLLLQQKLDEYDAENQQLQAQIEDYAEKIIELRTMNEDLTNKLVESGDIIEQLKQKTQELETQNACLNEGYRAMRTKLAQSQEMLAKEKRDNEINLITLRRNLEKSNKPLYQQYHYSQERRMHTDTTDTKENFFDSSSKIQKLFGSKPARINHQSHDFRSHLGNSERSRELPEKSHEYGLSHHHKKISSLLVDDDQSPNSSDLDMAPVTSNRKTKVLATKQSKNIQANSKKINDLNQKLSHISKPTAYHDQYPAHKRIVSSSARQFSNYSSESLNKPPLHNQSHPSRSRQNELEQDSSAAYDLDLENDSFDIY